MSLAALKHKPTRADFRALLRLAAPLVLIQVGTMLMGVVDTIMVGQVSPAALASVALGNMYFFSFSIFGMGVLFALDPIIAQALGARRRARGAPRVAARARAVARADACRSRSCCSRCGPVLELVNQPPEVIPDAAGFVLSQRAVGVAVLRVRRAAANAAGASPRAADRRHGRRREPRQRRAELRVDLRQLRFSGDGRARLGVGDDREPLAHGRRCCSRSAGGRCGRTCAHVAPNLLDVRPLLRMLKLGLPIGAQMMLEGGAFNIMALLMGWLGVVQVAAHQIALNLASLTFMVPLGVSSAAAVHRRPRRRARRSRGRAALDRRVADRRRRLHAVHGRCCSSWRPGRSRASIRPTRWCSRSRRCCCRSPACSQVFDGLQVVAIGLLRGLGDTRMPMIVNVVGFWCIGMPVSLWLGFGLGYGAVGLVVGARRRASSSSPCS